MILSASSMSTSKTCWRKAFYGYHYGLGYSNYNLADGSGLHAGVAHGLATGDWKKAREVGQEAFDKSSKDLTGDPTLDVLHWSHRNLVGDMVDCYSKAFEGVKGEFSVIMPEAQFKIELPNSHHHCIFKHWQCRDQHFWSDPDPQDMIEHRPLAMQGPDAEEIYSREVRSPHFYEDRTCVCWTPHYLVGTMDVLVRWFNAIWLMEHKTTAVEGQQFWSQFRLDLQPTLYLYAARKKTKLPVAGVIIDAVFKPSERQVASWNSRRKHGPDKTQSDYLSYGREAFTRSEAQLTQFEQDAIQHANEWERRVVEGYFPMANVRSICSMYNRPCERMELCQSDNWWEEVNRVYPREHLVQIQGEQVDVEA